MNRQIIILGLFLSSLNLKAQSNDQITNWFYDLPIHKNATRLKKAIQKNENFKEDVENVSENFKYLSSTFKGTIIRPILPKAGHLDSTKIKLSVGTLNTSDGYSGDMKWLFIEYFSRDTIFLNFLYEKACIDFTSNSKKEKPTGYKSMNNEAIGKGRKFIYINNYEELISISVLRIRYSTGKQSFEIHYSGSNN